MWFFSTLPPASLIGHELCPPLLCQPMLMESGLGWSTSNQDGAVLLQPLQAWVRTGFFPRVFHLQKKKKRWKEGGKTNFCFLFGSSGKAEGQGTVGEGGASLCLNYYAKNKTNKQKSSLPYTLWKVGPLRDSRFSLGAGRPKLGRCLLQPLWVSTDSGGGSVKVSKEAWDPQDP